MINIGIDIGKRRCTVCVIDAKGHVLEEGSYNNTYKEAARLAARLKKEYKRCQAACESTGNMWLKTFRAFEDQRIPILLANTLKMKIISETGAKTGPTRQYRRQKQNLKNAIHCIECDRSHPDGYVTCPGQGKACSISV